jgi:hypothetical protein
MGELIASSMSVPLPERLSRPTLSPVCLSERQVTSATLILPPTFTGTSSRRHRWRSIAPLSVPVSALGRRVGFLLAEQETALTEAIRAAFDLD